MHLPPSLRHRRFAIFWMGSILGWTGNQILIWTLLWHIRTFSDLPIALGAVGFIRVVPNILFSVFAGVAADSFSRRKVLFAAQGIMGLVALSLGLLSLANQTQLWHIYALLAVHAIASTFDLPSRLSLVPNLVPDRVLPNALSLTMVTFQIGGLAGPAISGILIEHLSQPAAYLASASFFSLILVALLLIGNIPQQKIERVRRGIDIQAIREGFLFTVRHPIILSTMLLDFFATLLVRADSLMPIFAKDILRVNVVAYGWLSAAQMIGGTLAGLILSQVRQIRRQGVLLLGAVVLMGLSATVFGLSRFFPLSMLALVLLGASDAVSSIVRSAIRQLQTPDHLRGRMVSVNQIFFMGGPQLGDLKSGLLGQVIGVPLAVAAGGMACILMVGGMNWRWPVIRAYSGDEGEIEIIR